MLYNVNELIAKKFKKIFGILKWKWSHMIIKIYWTLLVSKPFATNIKYFLVIFSLVSPLPYKGSANTPIYGWENRDIGMLSDLFKRKLKRESCAGETLVLPTLQLAAFSFLWVQQGVANTGIRLPLYVSFRAFLPFISSVPLEKLFTVLL